MGESQKLRNGSRVAILGGGPAGSFFAMYLLHYARQSNIHPLITIYQQRDFDELGTKGCKGCAGILSMSLLRNLGELGLSVPEDIVQERIGSYTVHSPYSSIGTSNPEKGGVIASIYRGGGPRISHFEKPISFDGWLLKEAQKRGASVEHQKVARVFLDPKTAVEAAGKVLGYDLVVLASGVNAGNITIVGHGYVPPKTATMAQDELDAGALQVKARLGNGAHAFLIPRSGLIFGTLVPKGPFINVSVLSTGKRPISMAEFLNYDTVRAVLPEHYTRACGCRPKVVVASARNYYADRFVAVGDAAVSRLYKDGIGSSLLTARRAAHTAVYHGVSRQEFERHYSPLCRNIDRDNRWGQLLFSINDKTKDSRSFSLAQHRLIGDEQDSARGPQPFTKAAWGMFTGSYSYRSIARTVFSPGPMARLLLSLISESLNNLSLKRDGSRKRLYTGGRKILILGSGFGGTYTMRHLIRSLNRNENVETTMVSDENFFLFSPLLHEVATGTIESRHIAYPIRKLHWRDSFNFLQAEVTKIDLHRREVSTSAGKLGFDYLVLALGSVTDMSKLNGQGRNVFTLHSLRDSRLMRDHIIGIFEQASIEKDPEKLKRMLTFVVSGGGYVGVQVVTELADFAFRSLTRFYRKINPKDVRVILVESGPKVLAQLHTRLSDYAMRQLKQKGIEVRLESRVTSVSEDHVQINSSENVSASTLIWVAGVVASPHIAELDVDKDSMGRVVVNEYMAVPAFPGVYAVGDCAHFVDPESGQPIPPRAHTAVRQAKVVANNILAEIRGRDRKPYRYSNTAEIISLGQSKAMLRFYGIRLYGLPARFIWVGAYSLLVTGTYNRIRVITDWLLSLAFGRDITYLKLDK